MRVTTEHIARSVAQTIEQEVLPTAAPGWPASYLRSALMLLTYLEDRAAMEPELLREDDGELAVLLRDGAAALESGGDTSDLVRRLREAADAGPDADAAEHEARRGALCELIAAVYRVDPASRPEPIQRITEAIAVYRERSLARDDAVWQRAETLSVM